MYVDFNRDKIVDASDEIIWTHDALKQGVQFYGDGSTSDSITFNSKGGVNNQGSITLCKNHDPTKARVLVVFMSGRVHMTAIGPNGKAEDSSGTELTTC